VPQRHVDLEARHDAEAVDAARQPAADRVIRGAIERAGGQGNDQPQCGMRIRRFAKLNGGRNADDEHAATADIVRAGSQFRGEGVIDRADRRAFVGRARGRRHHDVECDARCESEKPAFSAVSGDQQGITFCTCMWDGG
jgi:hypothetical protein